MTRVNLKKNTLYKKLKFFYIQFKLYSFLIVNNNFLLLNTIYFSNVSLLNYKDFLLKYEFDLKFFNFVKSKKNILSNFNNLIAIKDKDIDIILNKSFLVKLNYYLNLDIIYLKLKTHSKLISLGYFNNLFLIGNDLTEMRFRLVYILLLKKIYLVKILKKKNKNF